MANVADLWGSKWLFHDPYDTPDVAYVKVDSPTRDGGLNTSVHFTDKKNALITWGCADFLAAIELGILERIDG